MKSLVKKLWTAQDIATAADPGDAILAQRVHDESGSIQVELNQDPVAANAELVVQGRLSNDAPYVDIPNAVIDLNDADLATSPFSLILTGIGIPMDLKVITRANGGAYTIAGGTTANVWIQQ